MAWDLSVQVFSVLGQVGSIVVAAWTIKLWQETKHQRKAGHKPVLVPRELSGPVDTSSSLFASNYDYPVAEEIGESSLLYLGIQNIGPGTAMYTRVACFHPSVGDPRYSFPGSVHIAPGETVPLVIRFAFRNEPENVMGTHLLYIDYTDVYGDGHTLGLELWFENVHGKPSGPAAVVRKWASKHIPDKIKFPIYRYLELRGYFEVKKLFSSDPKSRSG